VPRTPIDRDSQITHLGVALRTATHRQKLFPSRAEAVADTLEQVWGAAH
jgi:hypothetical protein